MRILVSEASSPVAYHLLPLLASGDVTHGQAVSLVLCDREEHVKQLQEIAEDVIDCAFPRLQGISITSNFLEASVAVDVIVALPSAKQCDGHMQNDINVTCTFLDQIDFYGLDCAFHPLQMESEMSSSQTARGPLSIAALIANVFKESHRKSLLQLQSTPYGASLHEEAEFGRPPVSNNDANLMSCDHQFQPMSVQQNAITVVMLVTANDVKVTKEKDDAIDRYRDTKHVFYARL